MNATHTTLSDLGPVALSHRDAVDEVRRRIGITHNYFDAWIYGFLENKKFDIDETVAKLYRRFAFERDELAAHEVTEWMHDNLRRGIVQEIGNDKQGRVVLYVTSCRDKPQTARRDESRRTFDMFVTYCTRLRRDSMRCQLVMLINQDKASMWGNLDMTFQADIALRVAKYYPGAIDKMYICNMGRTLAAFAKPIFSRLPSIVSDRIQIITEGDIKNGALLELMDAAVLPVALGGRNACDDAAHWDSFAHRVERYYADMTWAVTECGKTVKEWELECVGVLPDAAQDGPAAAAAADAATTAASAAAHVEAVLTSAPRVESSPPRLTSVRPSRHASGLRAVASLPSTGDDAGDTSAIPHSTVTVAPATWPPPLPPPSSSSRVATTAHWPPQQQQQQQQAPQRPSTLPQPALLSLSSSLVSPDAVGALQTCLSTDDLAATAATGSNALQAPPPPPPPTTTTTLLLPARPAAHTYTTAYDGAAVLSGNGDAAWSDIMSALPPAVALFFLEELLQWRLVVEEQEHAARYALYDRSVADRVRWSHNQLKGLNVRDVRWYAMVPLPLRELYRLVLLGVTFINVVYVAAALVFFAVFAADVIVTVFFGFHVKPSHFFPLSCVLVNAMLQGLALCSRASDILVAVCRGRVVPMLERLGSYRGTMVEVVLFFVLVAVQFVLFCVYATRHGPLYGLQVTFATGWISAALLVAASHVFFFTGVFVSRKRDNRWATLPFFLALSAGSNGNSSGSNSGGTARHHHHHPHDDDNDHNKNTRNDHAILVASDHNDGGGGGGVAAGGAAATTTGGSGGGSRRVGYRLPFLGRHKQASLSGLSTSATAVTPRQQQPQQQQPHAHHAHDMLLYPHHHHHHRHKTAAATGPRWWWSSPHDATVRMSSSLICGVPVTVSMLLGIGFLLSRDVALFACTLAVSLVAAFCVNYYSDAAANSLSGALMRMTLWMMTVVWLYITFTFGFRGYDAAWLASVVVAGVLHGVFVLLSFCCLLRPHNSWLLRVSFLLILLYLVVCWVTLFPLLNYRLALLCLAFMLHNLLIVVLARRNLMSMTAVFLVAAAVLLLALACVLLGWYGTVLQYITPHSLPSMTGTAMSASAMTRAAASASGSAAVYSRPSLAAYHRYPVCTLRLGADASYTIIDVALLTEVVMAHTAATRRVDLTRWFASRGVIDDGVAAHFDSDDVSWELHRFRTAAAANTTFFVLNNRYAKSSIVSVVGWIDAIALSPLSIFLPAEWAAQLVYVMSFMTRLIDYEWRTLVPSLARYMAEQRRVLGTEVVLASFGVTGGVASAAAAQSHTQAIVFAAPGLLHVLRKFDVDADAYRRYVLAVGASQGVLDLVGGHDPTLKQRLRCDGSALHCLSQSFISSELLRVCGDVHGRRHAPVP